VERIDRKPLQPWREEAFEKTDININEAEAKKEITKLSEKPELVVYSDASSRRGNLGAAAVILDRNGRIKNAT